MSFMSSLKAQRSPRKQRCLPRVLVIMMIALLSLSEISFTSIYPYSGSPSTSSISFVSALTVNKLEKAGSKNVKVKHLVQVAESKSAEPCDDSMDD